MKMPSAGFLARRELERRIIATTFCPCGAVPGEGCCNKNAVTKARGRGRAPTSLHMVRVAAAALA